MSATWDPIAVTSLIVSIITAAGAMLTRCKRSRCCCGDVEFQSERSQSIAPEAVANESPRDEVPRPSDVALETIIQRAVHDSVLGLELHSNVSSRGESNVDIDGHGRGMGTIA